MKSSLAATFLQLGDATSRNLEFSHRRNVGVSYGEETITETNLLEIRRRHPGLVHVLAFPKREEAINGADWEWHVVGQRRTLKMRVQAKRLQRDGVLKVKHKVKSSGKEQQNLLVSGACAAGMKAVYCIYCTEQQRRIWKELAAPLGYRSFHTGCLLADAGDVPLTQGKFCKIEGKCIPWHYLVEPNDPRLRGHAHDPEGASEVGERCGCAATDSVHQQLVRGGGMRRSQADSTNRSLAAFGKLQHIRPQRLGQAADGLPTAPTGTRLIVVINQGGDFR